MKHDWTPKPYKATEEMLRAADKAFKDRDGLAARIVYAGIWSAMWRAAPAQPKDSMFLHMFSLLYEIRIAAGDPSGKLMQDELVDHIRKLAAQADALEVALASLGEIARAGMDRSDQPKEAVTAWHAGEFMGIAARARDKILAMRQTEPQREGESSHE